MNPSIWTPRYIANRVKLFFYEKAHKNEPWIPSNAIKALEKKLHKEMNGVEFGSGRSTVWYGNRIKHLTSIEDHKEWYDEVQLQLSHSGLTNVEYIFKSTHTCNDGLSEYSKYIESFKDHSLDFVVIDGKHRAKIAISAVQKIAVGGILLLDDSERYIAYPSKAPYAIGETTSKMTDDWKCFLDAVTGWKTEIFSNGVSDTTLFIKP